jgi:hypothetical protein
MSEIQDVRGTAFIVAEYRAQENAEQTPLYCDPIVPLFLASRRGAQPIAFLGVFRQAGEGSGSARAISTIGWTSSSVVAAAKS